MQRAIGTVERAAIIVSTFTYRNAYAPLVRQEKYTNESVEKLLNRSRVALAGTITSASAELVINWRVSTRAGALVTVTAYLLMISNVEEHKMYATVRNILILSSFTLLCNKKHRIISTRWNVSPPPGRVTPAGPVPGF
jgi:hypothetical protein